VLDRDCSEDTLSRRFAVLIDGVLDLLYLGKAQFKRRNVVLKARGIMKRLHWMATLAVLLLCTSAAFADSSPPDGKTGVVGIGDPPTLITSSSQSFTFTTCPGDPACSDFTSPQQAVFAATNATGNPWSYVDLTLTFASGTQFLPGDVLDCEGGGLFTITGGACGQTIAPGTTSLIAVFLQGAGTGIGCNDGTGASYDTSCLENTNYFQSGGGVPYYQSSCTGLTLPGCVDGPASFAIGVSGWITAPIGGVITTPEPSTFQLLGVGAMLAMLFLGLKKARLVHA